MYYVGRVRLGSCPLSMSKKISNYESSTLLACIAFAKVGEERPREKLCRRIA